MKKFLAVLLIICTKTAFANFLLGLPEGQLSSQLPGDTSYESMSGACKEIGGIIFGSGGQFCAVTESWTQLSSKLPGDTSYSDMKHACAFIGGISFGSIGQFCAVRGKWTQFSSRLPLASSFTSMREPCEALNGLLFGEHSEFCAVRLDIDRKEKNTKKTKNKDKK